MTTPGVRHQEEGHRRLRVLLFEPPAKTSHEFDTWGSVPDIDLTVVSDRHGWGEATEVVLPTWRPPVIGRHEGWTLAPVWFRGIDPRAFSSIDVIVSLELFSVTTLQAARLAARLRVPHVVHIAETRSDNPLYRLPPYRTITRRIGVHADRFVCVSQKALQHAIDLGCAPDRCDVVHLGVDVDTFRPAGPLEREKRVVFVGALRADRGADKGVREIIAACEIAREQTPDLQLTLVGDGHLRPELLAMARTRPFLTVRGPLSRAALPAVLAQHRLFITASKPTWKWEEQFCFALIEAMACGLPVVATRSGALPEVVPAGTALVPPGDIPALASAITRVIGPDAEPLGDANRRHALQRFDRRTQGRALRMLLEAAVA